MKTETQINAALREWLLEPLSDKQRQIIFHELRASKNETDAAFAKHSRNWGLPHDFTASLNSCRVVENRLPDALRLRYAMALSERCGSGWEGLAYATAMQRAETLCELLELL